MLNKRLVKILFSIGFLLSISLVSCEWNQYESDVVGIENINFSNDIMPIFNQNCNSIGCHNNGGVAPDLSPENAYQDLIDKNLIDLNSPPNSELYVRMTNVQAPMPISGVLSDKVLQTVLVWIEEGAQNN